MKGAGVRLCMLGKMPKIIAVGDLNASFDALRDILRGTGLIDRRCRWVGRTTELIQLGDIFNRGGGARESLELLLSLRREARAAGGRVTLLLGNHEAMVALRNEAYCTEEEYLSFATRREQREWPLRVERQLTRLARQYPKHGPISPIHPRLEAWKVGHVPGRAALRRALGKRGHLGREVRRFPIAVARGGIVFVHAGITARWARRGLACINRCLHDAWAESPYFFGALRKGHILRARGGPLWDRSYTGELERRATGRLKRALQLLEANRMVIGHTPTAHIAGGRDGRILLRCGGRLVCIDVGLKSGPDSPLAALIVDRRGGFEWTPRKVTALWRTSAT
jgi:hypothetical protein